jgi:hypothetical protein
MEVHVTEAVVTPDRYVLHGIFNVSVHDMSGKSVYWKALIKADGGKSMFFTLLPLTKAKLSTASFPDFKRTG